ncbi:molybdopterin molybdotransferase MoeA [Cellulomonas persica]|uniref:Molybdopterin molybdenumtransferase n=1 Tax=Cellulomonas persica TaxID=76861 RepID=A0A510UW36_9CELL|nr:gephyrin-like molybdotransferase Glp [Cellulomonas persica]GEK18779.1 molybdopterin molybdenumtransferase MoeA [Cellulomonas persica]
MRGLDEHRAATLALAAPLPAIEVPLLDALGLVLAVDVTTPSALPRWDNSAMDGYAVRAADVATAGADGPVALRVVADVAAGSPDEPVVAPGTAVRIMTGAPVPPGADAVVPVEQTTVPDDGMRAATTHEPAAHRWAGPGTHVEVRAAVTPGAHVRRAGEDAVAGDTVLRAGDVVGPAHVAAAASVGRASLVVHRRPRIAVVSTGDELVPPGAELRRGQIPDSNSWLLAAAVRDAGADALRLGPVPDDADALHRLLVALDAGEHGTVDGIVTSGGVSVGAFDVVKAALADEPGVEFVPVAVQPGKPQGLGRLPGGTPIWTLPGNPVSSYASFEVFVRPAIRRMLGLAEVERPRTLAVADEGWRTPPGRAQLMPVRRMPTAGTPTAGTPTAGTPTDGAPAGPAPAAGDRPRVSRATARGSGSHLVARLALAHGLAIVPAHVDEVHAGDTLEVFWT